MEKYMAHIRRNSDGDPIAEQTISQHCRNSAKYAAEALMPVGLSACGELAGLVHDAGKYTAAFQAYLLEQEGRRGSVNHTFAGVRLLLERFFSANSEDYSSVVSELLALAVGEHHGLLDCVDEKGKNGFEHRLKAEGIGYEEAVDNFFRFCMSEQELSGKFQKAQMELTPVLKRICAMTMTSDDERYDQETAFYTGLLSRLLLSAVIEGDRRDTAEFMSGASFPPVCDDEAREQLWSTLLTRMETKLDTLPQETPIDLARRKISDQCREAAEQPGGVFRLNVPTGGGKTLSSLRFALAHARRNCKRRIIFTSPLLSVLEQNARVIRDYIQDDSLILEHHSNLVRTEEDGEELERRELLTETWEQTIIITTLVQLINTLFAGKTTCIRRFSALCGSVIVMDEVQTVPSKMLSLFSLAVNFLSEICGATIVLCSATQPCTEQIEHPMHGPISELVPYDPALWQVFQRTDIQSMGCMSLEQIANFALETMNTVDSLLLVCNRKDQAERLYRQLKGGDFAIFSLSAAMCVAHRRETIDRLNGALKQHGQKVVCVSTQVIEAGVDISFACVIRLAAGMDSVVQAAGRCNRSGEAGPGVLAPVYLVECRDEKLTKLPDIERGKVATRALIADFVRDEAQYGGRLDSDEAICSYYRRLYRSEPKGHHDYFVKDCPSLFSLLSRNDCCTVKTTEETTEKTTKETSYYFRQAFRLAGSKFQVFEEDTADVIVPYGRGETLIADLGGERARRDMSYLRSLLEAAKPYTVSLHQYQIDQLHEEHALIPLAGGALGLSGHYDGETGFSKENNLEFLGVI